METSGLFQKIMKTELFVEVFRNGKLQRLPISVSILRSESQIKLLQAICQLQEAPCYLDNLIRWFKPICLHKANKVCDKHKYC